MDNSMTAWLAKLGGGDECAHQAIWERYFVRMVQLAQRRLGDLPPAAVWGQTRRTSRSSALSQFRAGSEEGAVSEVGRPGRPLEGARDNYRPQGGQPTPSAPDAKTWCRKRLRRNQFAGAAATGTVRPSIWISSWDRIPTPESAVMIAETMAELMKLLSDDTLRSVASQKLEGYTNDQIAERLQCTTRRIERKLNVIRRLWAGARDM